MSHLIRAREIKYNEVTDLIKEVGQKSHTDWVGLSKDEITAKMVDHLKIGSSNVKHALHRFITADPAMLVMKARVEQIQRRTRTPVLITGPTGVGKELIARALEIPGSPFISENCAGIPEQLVESIFFGHKKGAFTGAYEDHVGLLEEAGEGIIFLDEVGDLPLSLQAKFLRAIQEGEIRRVGSTQTIDLDCRFVAATKYDLEDRVTKGLFREDLYARLFTLAVHITGLEQRPNDIELIMRSKVANSDRFDEMPKLTEKQLALIYRLNVRAIEAFVERWQAYGSYD